MCLHLVVAEKRQEFVWKATHRKSRDAARFSGLYILFFKCFPELNSIFIHSFRKRANAKYDEKKRNIISGNNNNNNGDDDDDDNNDNS